MLERKAAGGAQLIELLEAHRHPTKAARVDALADEGHIISGRPVRPDQLRQQLVRPTKYTMCL
jgi:hypothetical protein